MADPAPVSLTVLALLLSLALLPSTSLHAAQGANKAELGGGKARRSSPSDYVPVRTVVYRSVALLATTAEASGGGVAGSEPFEVCKGCRCCSASNASSCVDTRCCYAIDCNIPGKPFGTCAFKPRTCDCGVANNCTRS